jgi:hypothetical protein
MRHFRNAFFTKVGQYTEEEFETAFGQFKATSKPLIFTYFKDEEIKIGRVNKKDLNSLWGFQEKLASLGHFWTSYENIDALKLRFNQQLDKLAEQAPEQIGNEFLLVSVDTGRYAVLANGEMVGITNRMIRLLPDEYIITLATTGNKRQSVSAVPPVHDLILIDTSIEEPRLIRFEIDNRPKKTITVSPRRGRQTKSG